MRFGRRRVRSSSPGAQRKPVFRPGAQSDATAAKVVQDIRRVDWATLGHAYGRADDVAPQLEALALGDDATRRAAWAELWGNVHHQGTVYEATVPAAGVIADLAKWTAFPDRREAICMLTAMAEGSGQYAAQVAAAVRTATAGLVAEWRDQSALLQRALLVLSRSVGSENVELRLSVLPDRLEAAWAQGTIAEIFAAFDGEEPFEDGERRRFQAAIDSLTDLEAWAFSED